MNDTSTDRRADLLRKVRGLIDTADSFEASGNTPAAQSYREKADQLMTLYAIEEFEVATAGNTKKGSPELRDFLYGDLPKEVRRPLVELFHSLAAHCRVKIGYYGWDKSKIVGYPQDLDYLDILFTSLRMHMSSSVRPRPSRTLGYAASLAMLKESGMKWKEAYVTLLPIFPEEFSGAIVSADELKVYEDSFRYARPNTDTPYEDTGHFEQRFIRVGDKIYWKEIPRKIGVRFTGQYTKFCEDTGRKRIYSDPTTYLHSFVEGYTAEIRQSLYQMRSATSEEVKGMGKELVLKSIMDDLLEFFYECFPEKRPHPPECDCDTCHFCGDPKCKRRRCVDARKPIRYRNVHERSLSAEGYRRGTAAGAAADLSGGSGVGPSRGKKELG